MLEQTTAMGHPPGTFVIFQAYFKPLQTVQIKKKIISEGTVIPK